MQDTALKIFSEIAQVPRPSGREEKIIAWLEAFAAKHNFNYKKDAAGNVLMQVPATAGYEKCPPVCLQSHVDMVCEKRPGLEHDFDNDPIRLKTEGDLLKAEGTTLGADNGIGMAMALAAAVSPECKHPPLELLFTVNEETGLVGASLLEPEFFQAKTLINLDEETEGTFVIGCAGGEDINISLHNLKRSPVTGYGRLINCRFSVTSLLGGHSGIDINKKGRANANTLAGRLLYSIWLKVPGMWLISVNGGASRNAIARDCVCEFLVPAKPKPLKPQTSGDLTFSPDYSARGTLEPLFAELKHQIEREYPSENLTGLKLELCDAPDDTAALSEADTRRIVGLLRAMPNGVYSYSPELGTVETSNNLGTVSLSRSDSVFTLGSLQRSSDPKRLDDIRDKILAIGELCGGSIKCSGRYASWTPAKESALLTRCIEVYKKHTGNEPRVKVIHAGLECGAIGSRMGGLDMISFGPDISSPHSPDENVSISSVKRIREFLFVLLESFTE
ncbi:Cytosol non-specific dipeptidase [Limihaloglobus sulfuriphilus]|uniref:Cytosol non-specific dipeptidase n=1 Tax=Limihaloglobus sulfuriphilus TaxID=1851148 RepID=A0A1Q2MHR0_9BACT|nr:beta-Ala-His dipeptidase [Limihaloglobus sulfuriphilus]AQQ72194.1 Cytosol non-specific dipeptidase [Limihaloglobus sulfuriphilus]